MRPPAIGVLYGGGGCAKRKATLMGARRMKPKHDSFRAAAKFENVFGAVKSLSLRGRRQTDIAFTALAAPRHAASEA